VSELLTVSEAAQRLKVSVSYLNKLRVFGGSARYLRLGRSIRYRPEDLDAWAQSKAANSTSEYTGRH
jgi:excisionase family DNA binding protein